MTDHAGRISRLQGSLDSENIDALLITNLVNVQYLCGFTGTNGQLLLTPNDAIFLSDPRYEARARVLVEGAELATYPSRLTDRLAPLLRDAKVKNLGFEAKTVTVFDQADLLERLDGVALAATAGLVERMRRRKGSDEVGLLRAAAALADRAFSWMVERLTPGMRELEVALTLEMKMREWGADGVSFPPIVGSGPLSAHIHHTPTDRQLRKGDLVLMDFGCRVSGYCSDLTRTVVLGPATDDQLSMYATVLAAQREGISALVPGKATAQVDSDARRVIEEAGMGSLFGHGLGHGVGLEVHEEPRLNRISGASLAVGDVVTVEPGIYLPDMGGIRIEDCIHVGEAGPEVLGSAPKGDLLEL